MRARKAWGVGLFLTLQTLDVVTTMIFLGQGTQEVNPIIRSLIAWAGVYPLWPLLWTKGIGIGLTFLIAAKYATEAQVLSFLYWANIIGALVVANNLIAIYIG